MIKSLLRPSLGVLLIVLVSAVLLLTDRGQHRRSSEAAGGSTAPLRKIPTVALFQHVSQPILEEGAKGTLDGLASLGFQDGTTMRLRRFNAEGDAATSNTIARALVGGEYDLIITLTTPSLQAVANANREANIPHVFGLVSDPVVAGVGIERGAPMKHRPNMVGLGTMQPVVEAFRMARKLAPNLRRVGVAWNPSEANSEACTKLARTACRELGIELLEANVDGSASVGEAVSSLLSRGAEAIWVGGDTTVMAALDAVVSPACAQGIPVFTNIPGSAARGTLFDIGADYYRVGGTVGQLAGRVLRGESPAKLPILYEVPPEFWINEVALAQIKGGWSFSDEVKSQADLVVVASGTERRRPRRGPKALDAAVFRPSRLWKLAVAAYSESTVTEEAFEGLREGLMSVGLEQGRDFSLDMRNAQGDIATLSVLFDELNSNDSDIVISMSTPALQAGLRKLDRKPLVFSVVIDPFRAGAAKSENDHRPNLTGAYLAYPYSEMVAAIREVLPHAVRIGTLFTPGEVNSLVGRERLEKALKHEGLELVAVPVNTSTEVSDAAASLCQSRIDLFCQISDNLSHASFPAIARACETARMPLFSFASGQVKRGALLAVGADYAENGRQAAQLVVEVMRGGDPSRIPLRPSTKVRRAVNLDVAKKLGISVPERWLAVADEVLPHQTEAPPAKK